MEYFVGESKELVWFARRRLWLRQYMDWCHFFYCFSTYSNVNTCSSYPWISTVLNHSWQMLTINMNLTLRPERLHGVSLFNITPDLKSLCHMSQYPTKLWQNTIANQTSSKIYAWKLPINYQSINQSINRSSNQQIKQSKD